MNFKKTVLRQLLASALSGLWPFLPLVAQTDSLHTLPEVSIRDFLPPETGYADRFSDSLPTSGISTLSERLLLEFPIALRANGPGALATLSARGAGPSRTAIFWQGLNLQSPMNGVVDAALLPLWPNDQIAYRPGGQSATQSSGAMGGALYLLPSLRFDSTAPRRQIGCSIGSFERQNAYGSLVLGGDKFNSLLRGSWRQAENDFPFKNTTLIGAPERRQANSRTENLDLQHYTVQKLGEKNRLETAFWLQRAFREIPPAMTEAPDQTWQRDRATRAVLRW
ncbi:MAG: Plug domain-containing protein, partial [Saprospiraceae bacterium]|nr:Plug domain-containing protein [Saprospiraceae bacterium]